ncbi:MAG: hypothetical protein JSV30_05870 [Candidatus Omnitrophota bacterium]|nr:MAG: hypothetical protein JSV30_05870 [Candidatus Omnitrophota bacterium]
MKGILKLNKHNKDKEIDFELNYLKSLSFQQRLQMCLQKSKEMKELLKKSGHRKTFEIIKRT